MQLIAFKRRGLWYFKDCRNSLLSPEAGFDQQGAWEYLTEAAEHSHDSEFEAVINELAIRYPGTVDYHTEDNWAQYAVCTQKLKLKEKDMGRQFVAHDTNPPTSVCSFRADAFTEALERLADEVSSPTYQIEKSELARAVEKHRSQLDEGQLKKLEAWLATAEDDEDLLWFSVG